MDTTQDSHKYVARDLMRCLAIALAIRILFLLLTPMVIDSADSILYLEAAQKMYNGEFAELYPRIPLLYPALVACVLAPVSDTELAGITVSLCAGTLLIIPVYLLAHLLRGRRVAGIAALIVAFWPWLIDYSCRVAPEALYCLCWFSAVWLLFRTIRTGGVAQFALPVVLLALYIARPEGVVIVLAIFLFAAVLRPQPKQAFVRLLPSIVLLAIAIPIHLSLMQQLAAQTGVPPRLSAASLDYSLIARGEQSARAALRLVFVTLPVMLGPVLGLFAVLGLTWRTAESRDRRAEVFVLLVALAQFGAAALSTFAEPRYVMTTLIALSIWTACGAIALSDWIAMRKPWLRHAPVALIVSLLCLGLAPNILPPMLGRMSYKPLEYKIAGRWMKDNLQPGLVLSRKPQIGFYAGMPTTGPAPEDTLEDVRTRVMDAKIRYVVVDERYSTQMIPCMKPLLEPSNAPKWLHLLKSDLSPYPNARLVLYEVRLESPSE